MAISVTDTAARALNGPSRHRFTVDDYYKMAEVGILKPDDRVQLIRGDIIDMPPIGPEHAGEVNRFTRIFVLAFSHRAVVAIQNPVRLERHSEPEPDVALLRPRDDDYRSAHPTPADVLLLVEVAASSLDFDRETKVSLYAEAGIPEYWIVNLVDSVVEVYREPKDGVYRSVQALKRGDTVQPLAFPDVTLALDDLLG